MNNSNKLAEILKLPLSGENLKVGDYVTCVTNEYHCVRFIKKQRLGVRLPDIDAVESINLKFDYKNGTIKTERPADGKESTSESDDKVALTIGGKYEVTSIESGMLDSEWLIGIVDNNGERRKLSQDYFNIKKRQLNELIISFFS